MEGKGKSVDVLIKLRSNLDVVRFQVEPSRIGQVFTRKTDDGRSLKWNLNKLSVSTSQAHLLDENYWLRSKSTSNQGHVDDTRSTY